MSLASMPSGHIKSEPPTPSRSRTPATGFPPTPRRTATDSTAYSEASNLGAEAPCLGDPVSLSLSNETWEQYEGRFSEVDTTLVKTWDRDLDTLLLFAALFSAVLTAFVIESYQYMKPASTDTEVLLQKILVTLQSNGGFPATPHSIDADQRTSSIATFVRINALWFASLVTSVSAAFLAMLCKEWLAYIHDGRNDASTEVHMRGRKIQLRYESMHKWRLSLVLSFLPVLLHVALLLFFAGLVDFLWYFNRTVGTVAGVLVAWMILVYIWTHIRSIFNATCPYRTSLTFLILIFVNSVRKWLSLDLPAAVARAWAFVAVVVQGYWSFRDAELFRAIWDILVASWFGRRWRALLDTLSDTQILPKNLWNLWARHIALGPTEIVRLREEAYITDQSDHMDARALARMIGAYPKASDNSQLVQELCNISSSMLIRHRALLIDAGAIDLLVHHWHLCHTPFSSRSTLQSQELEDKGHEITVLQTLARLLTEAETSDNRTVRFNIANVPLLWDFRLPWAPKYILLWYHPEESLIRYGLCQKDAKLDGDLDTLNIVLFSYRLRLQLVVSSSTWYTQDVKHSVDQFLEHLLRNDAVSDLDDGALISLANAAIFVGMRPIRAERSGIKQKKTTRDAESGEARDPADEEREMQTKHASKTLRALAALMSNRPDMGLPVLRQISWGIWMLSRPIPRSLSGLLVPTITSFDALAPALSGLLSPKLERNAVSDAILVLTTCLLQSKPGQYSGESDIMEPEVQLLRGELMANYLQYLRRLKSEMKPIARFLGIDVPNWHGIQGFTEFGDMREQVSSNILLNSLGHIIRIYALVRESDTYSIDVVEGVVIKGADILSATFDVLRATCEQLGRIKPAKPQDAHNLYALIVHFTCRAAIAHFHSKSRPSALVVTDMRGGQSGSVVSECLTAQCEDEDGNPMDEIHPAIMDRHWLADGDTSTQELAMQIEVALETAHQSTTRSTDTAGECLSHGIINTLLQVVALALPNTPSMLNAQLKEASTDVLSILRSRGRAETAIAGLADITHQDASVADRILEAIRDPVHAEDADTGHRASVNMDDHSDDHRILRRVHRGVVSVLGHP